MILVSVLGALLERGLSLHIGACLGLLFLGGLSLVGSVCELVCRRHCSEDFLVSASDNDGRAGILIVRRIRAHLW